VYPAQVGRSGQVEALLLVAERVAEGDGQTVLVTGEAGIGKSRLAREVAERLARAGWAVLQGSCFGRDRAQPYGPWQSSCVAASAAG
jgi:predicted ATPase